MKRIVTIAGAVLLTGIFAGPGFGANATVEAAQDGNTPSIEPKQNLTDDAGPGVQNGDTDAGAASDVDIGKTQANGARPSIDDVLSAIEGNAAAVSAVKSMTAVSKVHVVEVGSLPEADKTPVLERAIEANRSQIDTLREAIRTNTSLSAILDKKHVDGSAIVATRTGDDGSLTVYMK